VTERTVRAAIAVLALAGAGVAAYLTATKLSGAAPVCATGGCETVQSSRYSELAGVPVALLGLLGYLLLVGTAAVRDDLAAALGAAIALGAAVYAGYLLYVQASVIDAYCQWCLTSDVLLALLVPLTLVRLLRN
jgi:uncharacterized membrane protein